EKGTFILFRIAKNMNVPFSFRRSNSGRRREKVLTVSCRLDLGYILFAHVHHARRLLAEPPPIRLGPCRKRVRGVAVPEPTSGPISPTPSRRGSTPKIFRRPALAGDYMVESTTQAPVS